MVKRCPKAFASLVCLALFSISEADVNTESFESHYHARALVATEGFGEFVDEYLSGQGIGGLLRTREGKEMTKKTPHRRLRTKLKTAVGRSVQKPDETLLRQCLRDVLGFNSLTRPEASTVASRAISNESPTDFPTEFPTFYSTENPDRKLQGREFEEGRFIDNFIDVENHESGYDYDHDDEEDEDDEDEYDDEYDENYDDYSDLYIIPSWLGGHTFEEMNRRLSTCDIPTERTSTVSSSTENVLCTMISLYENLSNATCLYQSCFHDPFKYSQPCHSLSRVFLLLS